MVHRVGKLGLNHHPFRAPKFNTHVNLAQLKPKAAIDYHKAVKPSAWGMLLNDKLGDCVCAGMLHGAELRMANAWQSAWQPTDALALELYEAVGKYNPKDPNSDQGVDVEAMMMYAAHTGLDLGLQARDVALPLSVSPKNIPEIKIAIELFGFVGFSLALPTYVDSENGIFDVPPDGVDSEDGQPGGLGYHFVICGKYNTTGGNHWSIITWGEEWQMTDAFRAAYCVAVDTNVSRTWLNSKGISPPGLDWNQLMADRNKL